MVARAGAGTKAVTWEVEDSGGIETAWVRITGGRLLARGRVVGLGPEPYWLTYRLETTEGYVTSRLLVEGETAAGTRRLDLRRADDGTWTAGGEPVAGVEGALDCDLGRSPLTNTMPILRHRLHQGPGRHDFVMAWVAVPALTVHRSEQTYEHQRLTGDGAVVRYIGRHREFVGDLVTDPDGLLIHYPQLAHRLTVQDAAPGTVPAETA